MKTLIDLKAGSRHIVLAISVTTLMLATTTANAAPCPQPIVTAPNCPATIPPVGGQCNHTVKAYKTPNPQNPNSTNLPPVGVVCWYGGAGGRSRTNGQCSYMGGESCELPR